MILNEILSKYNILGALSLKEGENELSKELKVKIVRLRIEYSKIKKQFDADLQEFVTSDLIPEELKSLQNKESRTEAEELRMQELITKTNDEYNEFIIQKGLEDINFSKNDSFTEDEFDEIIALNAGNEVTINGSQVKAEELMETFYTLFVNKD